MYAFIADEYKTVVSTQRQLDFLLGIYNKPKFKKVDTIAEAKKFWSENEKSTISSDVIRYGGANKFSYITVEYFIADNNIYVNLRTKHFGFVKLSNLPNNVKQEVSFDLIKLKICNVILDNSLIAHHCLAICNIIRLLGPYMNLEIILPDISVFLALTKYTGKNPMIKKTKNELGSRFGYTYYTIKK